MKVTIRYEELTAEQKLRGFWHDFCDADPVPAEFANDMETAGLIEWDTADEDDADESFAWERGIELGGPIYRLTDAGRAALSTPAPKEEGGARG